MPQLSSTLAVRISTWVALCFAVVLSSGCLPQGTKFVPIQGIAGQAIVYVYRDSGLVGHGLDLEIFANRQSVVRLQVGTYQAMNLKPGPYTWTAAPHTTDSVVLSGITPGGLHGNALLRLDVIAGQTYFLKLAEGLGSLLIDPVSADEAKVDLQRLRAPNTQP